MIRVVACSLACSLLFTFAGHAAPIDDGDDADIESLAPAADDGAIGPAVPDGLQEINAARKALAAGDLDLCRNKLRSAYAKSPNLPPPKLMLARLLLTQRQVRLGRQMLEEVAVSHPNHPDLYLLFGKLALADGHATDAALHFQKALALEVPGNWNEGQKKYLQRACLEGQTLVAERRGEWDKAAGLYQQQVYERPKDADLRDRSAMALFQAGRQEQAFEQFDLAHLQDAKMNPAEISMAVMEVRAADFKKADTWFTKAMEKHAEDPAVYFEHSIAMLYQDRTKEAADSAAKAVKLGMQSELLTMHRGLIAMQQGDSAAAETFFEQVLQKSPDNAGAMTKLALVLIEQNDAKKQTRAIELAEAVGESHPNSTEAAAVLGWVYVRADNIDPKKKANAESLLRAAASRPSVDPLALFLYTRMQFSTKNSAEAQQAAKLLSERLDQPGLFVLRPMAKKWLATVMDSPAVP